MLESILGALKNQVGSQLESQAGVSSGMVDQILKITGNVATKEVSKEMLGGNLSNVMNLFSNQQNNAGANALQNNIMNGMVSNFVEKLGLNQQVANSATSIILPTLMNLITKKNSTTPDNDASPLNELFNVVAGGKTGSNPLGGLIGKTLGGLFGKK
ncbi:MAG: DUF937 domain-containing protein, partial [Chitinophagales bacterium]|nr:DUF937 domain-containing protein [Chitinophagales bacterium]